MNKYHVYHDLAVAYAQAKLIKKQSSENYNLNGYNEEIENFVKCYNHAYCELKNRTDY